MGVSYVYNFIYLPPNPLKGELLGHIKFLLNY
jgi:hypothetical protein